MKGIVFTGCVALFLGFVLVTHISPVPAGAQGRTDNRDEFVPGRVLVKFRSEIRPDHARQIIAAQGARDADEIQGIGVHIVDLPPQASESAFVQALMSRSEVEFAELDHILPLAQQLIPNDPFYTDPNAWGLQKSMAQRLGPGVPVARA